MISIDRRLLLGPEPYAIDELSETSKERRLLDTTYDSTSELEEFREFILQHQAEHEAWQARFRIERILPDVREALAREDTRAKCVRDYRVICGELFLLEEEAKLVAQLRPWAWHMTAGLDWDSDAAKELWRRFRLEQDEAWPRRKSFLQLRGELREVHTRDVT